MKTDYQKSQPTQCKKWIATGFVLGLIFTLVTTNPGLGIALGLILSFLVAIVVKRLSLATA